MCVFSILFTFFMMWRLFSHINYLPRNSKKAVCWVEKHIYLIYLQRGGGVVTWELMLLVVIHFYYFFFGKINDLLMRAMVKFSRKSNTARQRSEVWWLVASFSSQVKPISKAEAKQFYSMKQVDYLLLERWLVRQLLAIVDATILKLITNLVTFLYNHLFFQRLYI